MANAKQSTTWVRVAISIVLLAFLALFAINTFTHSQSSEVRASQYFSSEQIQQGLQFSYERKLLSWCGIGLQLALLTALVCSPWSRRLTDFFDRFTGRRWLLTLLLVGATYLALSELLYLPLGLARLEHSRTWSMTQRPVSAWFIDWGKGLVLAAVQGAVVVVGLYCLIRFFPRWWWLFAACLGAFLGMIYAFVMPEWIDPWFYKFTKLDDPYLLARVQSLTRQTGIDLGNVEVIDASSRGRHTNAYFTGFGSTRRVVLYDTLLQSHSGVNAESVTSMVGLIGAGGSAAPWEATSQVLAARTIGNDELETVLAHEIGHWRHDHIARGIALAAAGSLIGLFLLSRILNWAVGRGPFYLTSPFDPAGLPLILLLVMLASWLTMPIQNGISRYFERQADAASLELARKPGAFIEAEKRLARDNLSNVVPTPFNVWMFSTHPPTVERIEMAVEWSKGK